MTLEDFGRLWTIFCKSCDFPLYICQFYEKVLILPHTFEKIDFGASEFDTPIEDPKLDGRFVERIRGSSRESSIGVVKNGGPHSGSPSMGPLKTARTPTAATLFGE